MGNCSSASSSSTQRTSPEELQQPSATHTNNGGGTGGGVSQVGAIPSNNKSVNKSSKSGGGGGGGGGGTRGKNSSGGAGPGRASSPGPAGQSQNSGHTAGGAQTDPDSENGAAGGGKHSPHLGPSKDKDRPPPTPILSSAKPKGEKKKDRVLANKYVATSGGGGGGGSGGSDMHHHDHHRSHGGSSGGGGMAVQVDGSAGGAAAGEKGDFTPVQSLDHISHRRPSIQGMTVLDVSAPLPLEGDALSGHFLRVSSSPKHAHTSSPKHGRQASQGHSSRNERRRSRRSSEGRRMLAEANQQQGGEGPGADGIRTPPFVNPRRLTGNRDGGASSPPLGPTGHNRRQASNPLRRSGHGTGGGGGGGGGTRRRTSNNGMMSRLALQFPMVRTSFMAVYRAFEKYMHYVRKAEEAVEKRRSLRAGQLLNANINGMLMLRVADDSKLQSSDAQPPLSKQGTESRIGAGMPSASASQQSRLPQHHHHHTGQVAHHPAPSGGGGADLQLAMDHERSEIGTLVKVAGSGSDPANHSDHELDGMSEEEIRKHEIAALLAASPLPLLDAGVVETTPAAGTHARVASSASRGGAAASPTAVGASSSSSSSAALASIASSSQQQDDEAAAASGLVITTIPPLPSVSANRVNALGTLTVDRLGDALQAVTGSEHPLPETELNRIFSLADLDHSGGISFREFLVAVALGCFLKDDLERDRKAKEAEKEEQEQAKAKEKAAAAATAALAIQQPVPLHRITSRPLASAAAVAAGVPSPRRLDLQTDPPASSNGLQPSPKLGAAEQGGPPVVQINNLTPPVVASNASPRQVASSASSSSAAATSASSTGAATTATLSPRTAAAAAAAASSSSANSSPNARRPSLLTQSSGAGFSGGVIRTPSSSHFAEVARGFRVVYAAFREMDADHSESVERAELKRALFSAAPMKSDSALLESRFKELDFDDSGEINLPEFLYGVVSWVGLMEEDEEMEQRG